MKRKNALLPTTLGMLTAFGPFVTDFYLPALPSLTTFFNTTASKVQMTLTASLVGLSLGQILIGPISDKVGRKTPLLVSLGMFIVSTIACVFAPNVEVFLLLRLIQGVAGAGGIVLSKSISTDMFHGRALTNFMALLGAINGVAPVAAPVCGGLMLSFSNWQGIFILLMFIGIMLTIMSMALPETLTPKRRQTGSLIHSYLNLFRVLTNGRYLLCLLASATTMGVLFGYISSSAFILQLNYGLSPMAYGLCFAVNAFSIGIGSAISTRLKNENVCLLTGGISIFIMALFTSFALISQASIWVVEVAFVALLFAFGIIQPSVTSLALDSERKNAGAASAILGASGFLLGGIVSPIVGSGNILHSTSIVLSSCASLSAIFCCLLCGHIKRSGHLK